MWALLRSLYNLFDIDSFEVLKYHLRGHGIYSPISSIFTVAEEVAKVFVLRNFFFRGLRDMYYKDANCFKSVLNNINILFI